MATETDPGQKRVLIFIVAYNAEKTIGSVLGRIPESLRNKNTEVLVIDDSSKDKTFETGLSHKNALGDLKITMLRTPENQGYGGNQKLGYHYAIENGFDVVALVHGDGQYAPEKLPALLEPFLKDEADAVFGSRMINKKDALKGGMPLYKWLGNQVLTRFQNAVLGTNLSEFHSGYRLYSTKALEQIPFERNSNDFHFDTEIIIQLVMKKLHIVELPIPTYYGDEICHVNGLKYAWDIFKTTLRSKLHSRNLLYDRKYDIGPVEETYDVKLGFTSSHTMAIAAVKPGADILDIGCGRGYVAEQLAKAARRVTGIDQYVPAYSTNPKVEFHEWDLDSAHLPVDASQFDQIFILDVIEHLHDPEVFMEKLREATANRRSEIVITTANIAFFVTRTMLFFGFFNYGRKGILDRTHTRLFTFDSLRELVQQTGYKILEVQGIPAPFPLALGDNAFARGLVAVNNALIQLCGGFFSYQLFMRVQAKPTVPNLLIETISTSGELEKKAVAAPVI
jgi:glycosyltransferase involved in cell wall biosynthesis